MARLSDEPGSSEHLRLHTSEGDGSKNRQKAPSFMGLEHDYDMESTAARQLVLIHVCYTVAMKVIGFVLLVAVGAWSSQIRSLLTVRKTNLFYWAFFMSVSSFSNLGMHFWQDSLVLLSDNVALFLLVSFLCLAGNTCIPIFVRFAAWAARGIFQSKLPKAEQPLRCACIPSASCAPLSLTFPQKLFSQIS